MATLYIFGIKIPFNITLATLPKKQQQQLVNIWHSMLNKPLLAMFTINILLSAITNPLHRLVLKVWKMFKPTDILDVANNVFSHYLSIKDEIIAPNYVDKSLISMYYRRNSMSFIEFIRLNYYFGILPEQTPEEKIKTMNNILAVCFHLAGKQYDDMNVVAKSVIFQDLHPLIKYPIIESIRKEFDELINDYEKVFPKEEHNPNAEKKIINHGEVQKYWFQVARSRSQKITEIEVLFNFDATLILFDFEECIKEYEKFKRTNNVK